LENRRGGRGSDPFRLSMMLMRGLIEMLQSSCSHCGNTRVLAIQQTPSERWNMVANLTIHYCGPCGRSTDHEVHPDHVFICCECKRMKIEVAYLTTDGHRIGLVNGALDTAQNTREG
jgi:hypothetical protein